MSWKDRHTTTKSSRGNSLYRYIYILSTVNNFSNTHHWREYRWDESWDCRLWSFGTPSGTGQWTPKDLEEIIQELILVRHKGKPLPAAIDLDKVLRKLKVNLIGMISRHKKITELMKDDAKSTKSDHSGSASSEGATSIKLPKLGILTFNRDVLNWRAFRSSLGSQFTADPSCQMLRS